MSQPELWETNVPERIKELADKVGLQPYYTDQERAIVDYTNVLLLDINYHLQALRLDADTETAIRKLLLQYIDNRK